jgi:hypothetical protein
MMRLVELNLSTQCLTACWCQASISFCQQEKWGTTWKFTQAQDTFPFESSAGHNTSHATIYWICYWPFYNKNYIQPVVLQLILTCSYTKCQLLSLLWRRKDNRFDILFNLLSKSTSSLQSTCPLELYQQLSGDSWVTVRLHEMGSGKNLLPSVQIARHILFYLGHRFV